MKKHLTVAGFFASFGLIGVYLACSLAGDERAWWIALAAGVLLFLVLAPSFVVAGLKRAARYDAFEKTLPGQFERRFLLTLRQEGGTHTDARLYIFPDRLLFVKLRARKRFERGMTPDELTGCDKMGEDITLYLKAGGLLVLECADHEALGQAIEHWLERQPHAAE